MKTHHRFPNNIITPHLAALVAAFCLLFLPGCEKMPEEHARIAKDAGASPEKRSEALDKLTDERLLADAIKSIEGRQDWLVTDERLGKINDPQLLASLAR